MGSRTRQLPGFYLVAGLVLDGAYVLVCLVPWGLICCTLMNVELECTNGPIEVDIYIRYMRMTIAMYTDFPTSCLYNNCHYASVIWH